ncbi:hypothetical protein GcC1_n188008 [Golovinomyces cichoracearum]|uniref:Pentatricopeptide repeat-containing protein n=1 Tax=Golovinomyces cichoracearum TaxID=62708 RepID=A0A420HJD1_9PEZI|nr:hypothetical protein GcC1_n188008 [Golovinomyces cichoracearum]
MQPMPVPSDSALRILRKLAFGTSCTLAFALGITLEDRHHLIHTAHRIRNNTQKLKASKRYTTKGPSAIKAFEDRALSFQNDDSAGDELQSCCLSKANRPSRDKPFINKRTETLNLTLIPMVQSNDTEPRSHEQSYKIVTEKYKDLHTNPKSQIEKQTALISKLENDVTCFLEDNPPQLQSAANLFINTITERKGDGKASLRSIRDEKVLNLGITLFRACKNKKRYNDSKRIFQTILKRSIEEKLFIPFQLEKIIERLVGKANQQSLDEAVSIYFATLDRYAKFISCRFLDLGHKLCEKTFIYGQYYHTREIFNRMKNHSGRFPIESLGFFIMSCSTEKYYQPEIFEYYVNNFHRTFPLESYHNKIVKIVMNHLLENGKWTEAEQVIAVAAQISRRVGYLPPANPCINLIRKNWEIFKDFDKTMALFRRVKNYIHAAQNPWVFDEIMFRICVEAEEMTSAVFFLERLKKNKCLKLGSTLAQLTLLKARNGDIEGVEDDIKKIDQKEVADEYSKSFATILKVLSVKNTMTRTEKFIKLAFRMGISLNISSINKLAELYAKDRDFDGIAHLLEYMTNKGYKVDSVFFNMLLKQLSDNWRFQIEKVFLLLESILKLKTHRPIFNVNTFLFLRRLIFSKKQVSLSWKLEAQERLNRMFELNISKQKDPLNPKHILWEMVIALNLNDPKETLTIYDWACSRKIAMEPEHLNVAVEASFRHNNGDFVDAMRRIHASGLSGPRTAESIALLYVHQLQQLVVKRTSSADDIVGLTLQFISKFEKRGLKVPIQVITQTMSTLERLHNYHAVGAFWNLVSDRLGLNSARPNIATLTVFLKTYIGLRDIPGFWRVFNIMIRNRIVPDQRFCLVLDNARRRISLNLKSGKITGSQSKNFFASLLQGRALVNEIRSHARSERDSGTARIIQNIKDNLR